MDRSNKEIYFSVDVEASGPVPPTYSLLSIGACVVGKIDTSFYCELQPISDRVVTEAMKVVGKPIEYFVKRGREPKQAMEDFASWVIEVSLGGHPLLVGFNAAFDWAFVNWYFHRYSGLNPFGVSPIDIKAYFMGLTGCTWEETKSSKIPDRYKGEVEQTHNALDDAKSQAQMFERMLLRRDSGRED